MLLFIKLFDNSVQCLHMHHRALIGLLVVSVEGAYALDNHLTFTGTYPREVELRKLADNAPKHFGADVALACAGVVGDELCRQTALPFKVALYFAKALRLRPPRELKIQ